jgi:hypothetical protein
VEVTHVEQIPSVIDASLAKGATNIAGVEFSISNAEDVRRDALTEAVRKARADAEAMAKAAGGSLGNLIELTTSEPGMRPVFAMAMKAPTGAAMNMPTPIEPGERSVMATVTARWQFKPGGGRERKSGRLF